MPTKRQRDRTAARRRHGQKLNLENLSPKIAEGITEGASAREAMAEFPVKGKVDGEQLTGHMAGDVPMLEGTRIPRPRFVGRDDINSVWKENDGRLQRNAILAMDKETFQAMQAGHICLRCLEPQPEAFPAVCDLCGYPMQERQIMDIAMEFRGLDHIGPGAPIADYLAEQDERFGRMEAEARRAEGGSPMKAISRRILSPGAKRLRGLSGTVHASDDVVKALEEKKPDAA